MITISMQYLSYWEQQLQLNDAKSITTIHFITLNASN